MDVSILRDLARWTDNFFQAIGMKPLPASPPPQPPMPIKTSAPGLFLSPALKNYVRCAGLSGTLAICLGVYGAHKMKDNTPEELRRVCLYD